MSEHHPFCSRCGHPAHFCNTAGGTCSVQTFNASGVVLCLCPSPPLTTETERLALELAEVPRTLVAGAFERLGAMLPERGRPIARDAAKAIDETIVELMTKERRTVPR